VLGRLQVIVDVFPDAPDPLELTARVIDGGAPLVQVRPKGVTDRDAYEVCARIADACRAAGVTCIINDRVDLALAVGAHGVHVGLTDLPIGVVARLAGAGVHVGGTARDPSNAAVHERDGATYVGIGPIYATSSKSGLPDPLGPQMLARVARAVSIPIIAISGVTVERVPELFDAGAYGVAVIGAVSRAADPRAATAAFVAAIERHGVAVGR
jgi:thiamine-phosphate pyrophosphorylase